MGCKKSKPKRKPPVESATFIGAVMLIQRWHRRHLARLEMRKLATWNIFQNLEYASEQDQAELYKFFNDLLAIYPEVSRSKTHASSQSFRSATHLANTFDEPDRSYLGPHLRFPLEKKDIDILIDLFRKKGSLHPKYVAQLFLESAMKLQDLPNLNIISTGTAKQVTIVGDLHGKLEDLLVIFHKNGLPSAENPYVFNGDYVDRGKRGLEVFLLVLACFLAFPGSVSPNRGNHEDTMMNARYGFLREVQMKYTKYSDELLAYLEEVYRWLPIGTIINNKVLVVHGGISDTTNLEMLRRLNRSKYKSILRPPREANTEVIDKREWKQLFDVMWSDPQQLNGCVPNKARGAGALFGPDITLKFLTRYRLAYIIRSHECKPEGYEFTHNERVITIFSASNYYVAGSNRGAYMKLNQQLDPHFVQYVASASKTSPFTFEQKVGFVEASALRELGARLRVHKREIEKQCRKYDPHNTGQVTEANWCTAMEDATHLGLPWHVLCTKLAPGPKLPNHLNYKSTLELLDTDTMVEAEKNETSVIDSLYSNKSSLEAIFHILDKDHSGYISIDEFVDTCGLLESHLGRSPTRNQLIELCKLMDINNDGLVSLNEFLEAFRLSGQSVRDQKRKSEGGGPTRDKPSASVDAAATRIAKQSTLATSTDNEIDPSDYEVRSMRPHVEKLINVLRASRPFKKDK